MKLRAYNSFILIELMVNPEKKFGTIVYKAKDDGDGLFMDAGRIVSVGPTAFGAYEYLHKLNKPTESELIGKHVFFNCKRWDTAFFGQHNAWLDEEEKHKRFKLIDAGDVMAFINIKDEDLENYYPSKARMEELLKLERQEAEILGSY